MMIRVVPDTHSASEVQRQDLTSGIEAIPEEDVARGPEILGAGASQTSTEVTGVEGGQSVILVNSREKAKAKKDDDNNSLDKIGQFVNEIHDGVFDLDGDGEIDVKTVQKDQTSVHTFGKDQTCAETIVDSVVQTAMIRVLLRSPRVRVLLKVR
ncbi:hypothetical protein LWI28_021405 [Acer negundo]|uniref:Uncharacterized protein n=1 Tax=Acer negundo TaxID=4023 RepID=A0AAD5JCB7_ACENE|nr:hypothetical protein LWI28_021405 [Acer negundo]